MAIPWFKQIRGDEKRTRTRWMSISQDPGEKRNKEREIGEKIAKFKRKMDSRGVVFRDDRDAWEAYWDENRAAHKEMSGESVDVALGEVAFRVFRSYWQRLSKREQLPVRFDGDGVIAEPPALLTLGQGANRIRANPIDALRSNDPEVRARAVVLVDNAVERCEKIVARTEYRRGYLLKLRQGLQGNAIASDKDGEILIQGLLEAPEEMDDDAE